MKKSNEIIGLPVISITEGRELGMSKTLLIDAKNRRIAAITIEDEDWYRGVKLIPYDSVIAIGNDAVTVTSSETIIKLDEAADFENLLDENIRIIGTKAITKAGTIEGAVTEIYIGDDGTIERCEVTGADGATTEVTIEQISIFGKQVTVIDSGDLPEKKNSSITLSPIPTPAPKAETPKVDVPKAEEVKAEIPAANPTVGIPAAVSPAPEVKHEEVKAEVLPPVDAPKVEEVKADEPVIDVPAVELPKVEEPKKEEVKVEAPKVEEPKAEVPKAEPPKAEEPKKEEAKAAPNVEAPKVDAPKADAKPAAPAAKPMDKAQEDRHRRFLLGKKATRKIEMDNGIVIVDAGAEITEEVLQKAKLANKFTELAMNAQ